MLLQQRGYLPEFIRAPLNSVSSALGVNYFGERSEQGMDSPHNPCTLHTPIPQTVEDLESFDEDDQFKSLGASTENPGASRNINLFQGQPQSADRHLQNSTRTQNTNIYRSNDPRKDNPIRPSALASSQGVSVDAAQYTTYRSNDPRKDNPIRPGALASSQGVAVDAAQYTTGELELPNLNFLSDCKNDRTRREPTVQQRPLPVGQRLATSPGQHTPTTPGRTANNGRLSFDASYSTPNSRSSSFDSPQHTPEEVHAPPPAYHSKPDSKTPDYKPDRSYPYVPTGDTLHHQGISSLMRLFTREEFTWTILKDLDDQLVERDLVQLKFLCKEYVSGGDLHQVDRAYQLFEHLQNRGLISERRFPMLAELLYRIRRIDLLKKLVTDTKRYQELVQRTPTSLKEYRILLHEIIEDTIDKEFNVMKFFVSGYFHKPKLTEMKAPQDLFIALEQKDLLGPDNLDLLIKMMMTADKGSMVNKIMRFRGSYFPDNPPPLDFFNKQNEMSENNKSYGREATACFAAGTLKQYGAGIPNKNDSRDEYLPRAYDMARREEEEFHYEVGRQNDNDRPGMLLSVGVPDTAEIMDGDLPCYKMDASPRGLCVIFNNRRFHKIPGDDMSKELKPREGSDVDKGNLEYIFNRLDFTVKVYEDVTAKELVSVLHDYAMSQDHSQYDCFVCCILTHGKQDRLYGVDGKLVEIRELTNFFKAAFCPTLIGKPKLFFIQACQGREKQQGYLPDQDPLQHDLEADDSGHTYGPKESIPNEADFLLAYATLPGFVSYRSRTHGSWFVNALVENIERYSHKYDLLSIMIKVNEEVAKMSAPLVDGEYKQVPLPHPTLRKRIFFKTTR